jgi:hypothetical protein
MNKRALWAIVLVAALAATVGGLRLLPRDRGADQPKMAEEEVGLHTINYFIAEARAKGAKRAADGERGQPCTVHIVLEFGGPGTLGHDLVTTCSAEEIRDKRYCFQAPVKTPAQCFDATPVTPDETARLRALEPWHFRQGAQPGPGR